MTSVSGYDPGFLAVPLPLPRPAANSPVAELAYTHFTVLLHRTRRLAVLTGVNIDGPTLRDVDRGDDWHLDRRVPAEEQTGPEVYARNDLDRGHLVRRLDPVWGDLATATRAEVDSFSYANAAPQAAMFNQGKRLWAGLEDYLLGHAETYDQRLSVFTAPVLAASDPSYRGVQIPRRFFKVAAWATSTPPTLAATGYLLDQTPQLEDVDLSTRRALTAGDPPPLGPYRTYQVPITDIATLTALDLGGLPAADRLPVPAAVPSRTLRPESTVRTGRWRELRDLEDVQLRRPDPR